VRPAQRSQRPAQRRTGVRLLHGAIEWREQDSNLRRLSRLVYSQVPLAARASLRVDIVLVTTLSQDLAKQIVKDIKATKLKVTPTNMGDRIRVASKKRDDLQEIQAMIRSKDHDAPLRFTNYK
jgi:uncharacterized protein YajQ (UPF0234 family)